MDHLMTSLLAVTLVCICVTSLPVSDDTNINKLSDLLGKLRALQRKRQGALNWGHLKSAIESDAKTALSDLEHAKGSIGQDGLHMPLTDDSVGLRKRQGTWSYDYGLGGGRFGKRNYGDYGIGGGRFGRDVDHVDLAD